ncbi:acyl CoA binding protein-domain-containing protein [Clohesyomyces aquaticus]|uniref:Acyl CoA binding protein-domain-containing protein n=1 Tax=Clohesyomyces aquaticus TaxID=1231657 RepID=A0A1Y1ZYW6_9PLEO|nr:acyl CoA binding protein-domain-containing protein [Clohesyomyces aquaticus]
MSDSVDRVFSHALNTVNKIRTGSQKPPSNIRLRLYGLYKQAMEGDVDGIMERPEGAGEEAHRAREKWDAWKQQNGLSRTESKRRYITTLIDTMHKYASPSPDSRELVAELEFVWDQVKSNVPSSSSSSPLQTLGSMGLHMPPNYPQLGTSGASRTFRDKVDNEDAPLQIRSPMSQSEEDELEEDQPEEFVDAQDSQYNPNTEGEDAAVQADLDAEEGPSYSRALIKPKTPTPPPPPAENPSDQKWRKRVEQALVKMTAEVAALREQLEEQRLFTPSRRYRFLRFIWRFFWGGLKVIAIDIVVLGLILLWLRRRKDRRLEGAMRVLLGDAVAQVQKVGGAQIGKLPGLKGTKIKPS